MIGFFFTGGIDQSLIDRGLRQIIANPEITAGNPAGKIGAWFSDLLINRWFGLSSFIFCYIFILAGICIAGKTIRNFPKKIILSIFGIIWISLFLGYVSELSYTLLNISSSYLYPGGAHGYFVSQWLNSVIGGIGTFFILLLTFVILLFFGFEKTFYKCIGFIKHLFSPKAKVVKTTDNVTAPEDIKETVAGLADLPEDLLTNTTEDPEFDPGKEFDKFPEDEYLNAPFTFETEKEAEKQEAERPEPGFENIPVSIEDFELPNDLSDIQSTDIPEKDKPDTPDSEAVELTINDENKEETLSTNLQPQGDYDPTLDLSNYRYPNLDLLEEHSSGNPKVTQEELDENKNKIVETLRNYKIEIVKIKATIGPTVTLYEIIPAPGVKISKIKNLEDDIALSLAALGIRIIAPIPGAGTIGIEVPNQNPEVVSMRGIIASKKFQESKYALPIAMGRTISNETYTFDLAKMPHLLVAGATGQGKSVGLNAIITSLLYKKHPAQLKFVMVDPKKVELSIYSVIEKHFLAKLPDEDEAIITETSKVINTLNSLCIEMDSRYDLLKEAQVRNIKEYNEKFVKRQLNPNKGHKYLPYIVVVVDEFADLIMTAREVEGPVMRLAQKARAIGIHLIIATQRPDVKVITGGIKANFPARIAFRVMQMIDSRTIIDQPGANQLIGRGDMLFSKDGELTRIQCALVETKEVERVVDYISRQQGYTEAYPLPDYTPDADGGGSSQGSEESAPVKYDSLFAEIARDAVSGGNISTSMIQRNYEVGFNRAGRIMTQLERAGIVGRQQGAKPRDILFHDLPSLEAKLQDLGLF